jgi:hypothetical protein
MNAPSILQGKPVLHVMANERKRNIIILRDGPQSPTGAAERPPFAAHLLVDGINKECGTRLKVWSPWTADAALTNDKPLEQLPLSFVVDACIGYELPGKKLGKEIIFTTSAGLKLVLPTGPYKGEPDTALVVLGLAPADLIKQQNYIVINALESQLIPLRNFPRPSADEPANFTTWHSPHELALVPHGRALYRGAFPRPHTHARSLIRKSDSSFVGLIVRHGLLPWQIDASGRNSAEPGVVAEFPDGDLGKICALTCQPAPPLVHGRIRAPKRTNAQFRLLGAGALKDKHVRLPPRS